MRYELKDGWIRTLDGRNIPFAHGVMVLEPLEDGDPGPPPMTAFEIDGGIYRIGPDPNEGTPGVAIVIAAIMAISIVAAIAIVLLLEGAGR